MSGVVSSQSLPVAAQSTGVLPCTATSLRIAVAVLGTVAATCTRKRSVTEPPAVMLTALVFEHTAALHVKSLPAGRNVVFAGTPSTTSPANRVAAWEPATWRMRISYSSTSPGATLVPGAPPFTAPSTLSTWSWGGAIAGKLHEARSRPRSPPLARDELPASVMVPVARSIA